MKCKICNQTFEDTEFENHFKQYHPDIWQLYQNRPTKFKIKFLTKISLFLSSCGFIILFVNIITCNTNLLPTMFFIPAIIISLIDIFKTKKKIKKYEYKDGELK